MSRNLKRRLRAWTMNAFFGVLIQLLRGFTWGGAQRIGRLLGRILWRLVRVERERAMRHLEMVWPEKDAAWREAIGRGCFRHLSVLLMELLWLATRDCGAVRRLVRVEGWEEVERARAEERPILIVTGHCGNWELLAAVINCMGLPLSVMARQMDDRHVDERLVRVRAHFGTETIGRGTPGAARKLLRTLRDGGALGMLIDQDTQVEGVWVPFFGRLAYTPVGAAEFALRRGAAAIPAFIEREEDGTHRAVFHPPLELPEDPAVATALMTECIEAQVRRVPEQWVWMHRRWKRRPEDVEKAVVGAPPDQEGPETAQDLRTG